MTPARPDQILAVLQGARARIFAGFAMQGCVCCQREDDEVPPRTPYPSADGNTWCFLCAVEAEQMTLGVDGDAFSLALAELAFDMTGVHYGLQEIEARDAPLWAYFDAAGEAKAVAAFDTTIRRLVPSAQQSATAA